MRWVSTHADGHVFRHVDAGAAEAGYTHAGLAAQMAKPDFRHSWSWRHDGPKSRDWVPAIRSGHVRCNASEQSGAGDMLCGAYDPHRRRCRSWLGRRRGCNLGQATEVKRQSLIAIVP